MYTVGNMVRVLAPFNESFLGVYEITEIVVNDDGSTAYILGDNGGFDAKFLEIAG